MKGLGGYIEGNIERIGGGILKGLGGILRGILKGLGGILKGLGGILKGLGEYWVKANMKLKACYIMLLLVSLNQSQNWTFFFSV